MAGTKFLFRTSLDLGILDDWVQAYYAAPKDLQLTSSYVALRQSLSTAFYHLGSLNYYTSDAAQGAVVCDLMMNDPLRSPHSVVSHAAMQRINGYYRRWKSITDGNDSIPVSWNDLILPEEFIGAEWKIMEGQEDE